MFVLLIFILNVIYLCLIYFALSTVCDDCCLKGVKQQPNVACLLFKKREMYDFQSEA